MPRQRFQRKDLKRPDEFVAEGLQLLAWARQNTRLLTGVGAAVAAIALAYVSVTAVREARSRQASEDLSQALADFQSKNFSAAAPKLADVSARWESTMAGRIARLIAADAQIRASGYDAASGLLQDLPDKAQWPPYLVQHATLALAVAAERKGDDAAAATHFAEASALEGPYTAIAIFEEARCRERSGQKDQARKLYERLTREFPEAPEREFATTRIDALKG